MARKKEQLVIIDGNALIHRGFHAMPQSLRTTDGVLVNGVYGFTSALLNVMKELKPEYFIVAFDTPGPVFRHKKFKDYKAKRAKAPDELLEQIPITHHVVEAMSIPIYEEKDYEADDVIGSLSRRIQELNKKEGKNIETYIVTGDGDTLQLVDKNTKVYKFRGSQVDIYDEKRIKQEFGFGPESMIDYRGLKGDSSDNIPGVPGVGEKTALAIIQHFKTIDRLYKALDKVEIGEELAAGDYVIKGKVLENLKNHKKEAFLSREISEIVLDMKLKIDLRKASLENYDRNEVVDLFHELQFKSLLKRLPEAEASAHAGERIVNGNAVAAKKTKEQASLFDGSVKKPGVLARDYSKMLKDSRYQGVTTEKQLKDLVEKLKKQKEFAFDTETSALSAMNSDLVGMSFSWKKGEAYYVPVGHAEGEQVDRAKALQMLKPVLENSKIGKIGHHIKYDFVVMLQHGVELKGISFDTLLAAYLFNPGERGLKLDDLAFAELNIEMMPITELIGTGAKQGSFKDVPLDPAIYYAAEDADITYQLKEIYAKRVAQDKSVKKIFETLEVPIVPVLGKVEHNGILVDVPYLEKTSKEFEKQILKVSERVFKKVGKRFNLSSPSQLADILFNKMKVPTEGIAKTKSGFSTAASELEKLRGKSEIVDEILEYRELTKLKGTYLDALPKMVHPETKRIHTTYNQTIAATGRLSSIDPNLQNIPVRTETGIKIRKAFYADRGKTLVALDYSQIELRIMAHMSGDETFVRAFKRGTDIHAEVAAEIHNKKPEDVTKKERSEAKVINFSILYGVGARGLSAQTTMTYAEAKEFMEAYFEMHPKIREIIDTTKAEAHKNGYAETLYGRRRPLPDLNSSMPMIRAAAERAAINMPYQGMNADIMKLAMLKIVNDIPEAQDMMLLQVHDELIFEVPDAKVKQYAKKFQTIMENIYPLDVPLAVNVEVGKRWSDLKELSL